jgi:demethylmenaquinone methyltransferase/2-methoxy-6-polyprenyl-1,4-benzoquinol methylase
MEVNSKQAIVHRFFSGTGPTYDHIVNLCTVGFDKWWKRKILEKIPKEPRRIIDQACGTGILTFQIARKFPSCQVIGVELRSEYLNIAKKRSKTLGLHNVDFVLGRAEDVSLNEEFDCITSSYLAKYAEIELLVRNVGRMLKPAGVLIVHDFTHPPSRAIATVWELYFLLLQSLGAWKYPQWREALYGLPQLLRETHWVSELKGSLQGNGFSDIEATPFTFGISTAVTATKR